MTTKILASVAAALLALALFAWLTAGCGPGQHPCVTAYDKARTEAEVAEVDKACGHMLLGGGGQGGAT